MRIAILNGNPNPDDRAFEEYLREFEDAARARGFETETLTLRDMEIRHCLGCWGCWLKTPGRCLVQDDSERVCRAYMNAGLVVFASPVIMGMTSALLKRAQDKLIPLLLPYLEIDRGECHHRSRYARYPAIGLLLQREGADDEDVETIAGMFRRFAINFKSYLAFAHTTGTEAEVLANEAGNL